MVGAKNFFDEEDNTHVMLFFLDAGREGNRGPIRKVLAAKETENDPKEFFLHLVGTNEKTVPWRRDSRRHRVYVCGGPQGHVPHQEEGQDPVRG